MAYDIFDEAREEVLAVMEVRINFGAREINSPSSMLTRFRGTTSCFVYTRSRGDNVPLPLCNMSNILQTNFQRGFLATERFQRIQDASEKEQRELRMLRAGGMLAVGTPSTPSPVATGSQRPPGSPPLLTGLVAVLRKLPSFVTTAEAASDRRPWRRNARDGGAARVSADSLGASGRGEAKAGESISARGETLEHENRLIISS